jgi:ATP phosphoribosyltransferase regulatory subunit
MSRAADAIREAASALAGMWVEPPVLQPSGLYLELLGEDLRARAYMVAGDDDSLCLRPDMTAPAVRLALAQAAWGGPFGVAYDGHVFRRPPDSARESEFRQIGVEKFGPSRALDAEEAQLMVATLEACRAAGVSPRLRLGDVAVFDALIDACALGDVWTRRIKRAFARPGGLAAALKVARAVEPAQTHPLAQALAAMPPDRAEAVVSEMLADARIPLVGGRSLQEIALRLREQGSAEVAAPPSVDALAAIADAVALEAAPEQALAGLAKIARRLAAPAPFEAALALAAKRWAEVSRAHSGEALFSAGFGRGLAFYDGFVFELEAPTLGGRASLGGGGRYDGLLHRIAASEGGGPSDVATWGAVGFALRPGRMDEAAS